MDAARLEKVVAWIDAANACDPHLDEETGQPRELLYGRRMSGWLARVCPDPPEALQIAARGQHIRRWEVPRDRYPATREGYLRWRAGLYGFHAERVAELMAQAGYAPDSIDRVGTLLRKRGIKTDTEVQTLEDVACLVFLQHYLAGFAATHAHDPDKLAAILRKTWGKMSERGRTLALQQTYPEAIQALLAQALREA